MSHLSWCEWPPNLLAQGTLWGWFVVTLALCPCGHYLHHWWCKTLSLCLVMFIMRTISTDIDLQWLKHALCYCTLSATLPVPWSCSVAIVLCLYICNLLTRLLAWKEQTGQDSMSSDHLKLLQSADKHLTKRLFRYTGGGATLVNAYLHFGICFQTCQFPLVKEMLANFLQSVRTKSYPKVFIISTCNPPQCNCFNLYM